jgi:hypothetical protein
MRSDVSGLESDGGDRFLCGRRSGTLEAVSPGEATVRDRRRSEARTLRAGATSRRLPRATGSTQARRLRANGAIFLQERMRFALPRGELSQHPRNLLIPSPPAQYSHERFRISARYRTSTWEIAVG